MANQKNEIKFALQFPQGLVVLLKNQPPYNTNEAGASYFLPNNSTDAFMIWGERKELFGKNAITVAKDRETGAGGFSVVYEFSGAGALLDARLVSGAETVQGKLADDKTVQAVNDLFAQDKIKLYGRQDAELSKVFNVASFPDGRLLIQLFNKNELYLGTPGNYQKLDAKLQAQGGNSMYYKLATGESIELPYSYGGPGQRDVPKFNGEELTYKNVRSGEDPAKFGLDLTTDFVYLDPFSPQLAKPAAPQVTTPKPPKQ